MWDNWKLMHIGLTIGWVGGELASLLEALQMQIFSLGIQFLQENTTQLLTWEDICLVPGFWEPHEWGLVVYGVEVFIQLGSNRIIVEILFYGSHL